MPYQPQRFIHAANVRLDVPVSVYLSEQLTDDLRHELEDATLSSFDCVIENCIQRKVDYLLLSGNLFVEADRSLRARLSLLNGFRRLDKQGICVFVLPGDTDPPEAWRAIPELPDNVRICYSSNSEPVALERGTRTVATVSASMWYGETDAFGIRVIHSSPDGIEPFRIGTASRSKFDESRRMARLTESVEDNLISLPDESGTTASVAAPTKSESETEYEVAFQAYMSKLMHEGRLNYMALGSELDRSLLHLEDGMVHCPGTTQPRSQLEADCGLCSLISVDVAGHVTCEEINTSAVDWKNLTLRITSGTNVNQLLQRMRAVLEEMPCSPSDRIWSVCWTLTGPLPDLRSFQEEDLELAVTVELDRFDADGRSIRLLHQVHLLPDAWQLEDNEHLAQQYAELIPQDADLDPSGIPQHSTNLEITEGWTRRLESLATGIDSERLLAQLRNDGADWFVADLEELYPPTIEVDADLDYLSAAQMSADTESVEDSSTENDATGTASTVAVAEEDDESSSQSTSDS